jgi:hypothetical protein
MSYVPTTCAALAEVTPYPLLLYLSLTHTLSHALPALSLSSLRRLKVWSDDPSAPSGGADSAKANGNVAELGETLLP